MKRTTEQFKKELMIIQPNLEVLGEYINTDTKIIVKDELEIRYLCTPYKLLQGKKPSILSAEDKNIAFEIKANNIHKNKYNYKDTKYLDALKKVNIICPKHGTFKISPSDHLSGGGCKNCADEERGFNKRENTVSFIEKAKKKHENFYIYKNVKYITAIKKIEIICPLHGSFFQKPSNHLSGQGCPFCKKNKISKKAKENSYGWSLSKWKEKIKNSPNAKPKLYVLECFNETERFIKIGITIHDIKKRYPGKSQMPYNFTLLYEILNSAEKIFLLEQQIKKTFKQFKKIPLIKFNGSYESFDLNSKTDILNFVINNS